ncbi:MAG: response regulator transcription factor [Acidobacteriota bacterium]
MRLLVVEDEPRLAADLRSALEAAGYAVDVAHDGAAADVCVETERYDCVILDLGLPRIDGLTLLDRWRRTGKTMAVLLLTARDSWHEKVEGIDAGADDYVAKPFHIEEVIARVRALIRRSAGHAEAELRCGPVTLHVPRARVSVNNVPVTLTSHEFRILSYLMHHRGRVVGQSELIEHVYAQSFDRDSNTVEVFVSRLRRKLGVDCIRTVRGLGYCLEEPVP